MDPIDIPGLTLMHDLSASEWLVAGLKPWSREGARVESFVPDVFESYARVLHPIRSADHSRRWSELAEPLGNEVGPETSFREATGSDADAEPTYELSQQTFIVLRGLLAPATTTPDRCWFCIWVGYGFWHPGATAQLVASSESLPRARRRKRRRDKARDPTESIPQVRTQHREYFLFNGPLADQTFMFDLWFQPPNVWWPDDRVWCVATELDGFSTYVGGNRACIDALLASPDLEVVEVDPQTLMDPGPFR